jgi:hypothetical protein
LKQNFGQSSDDNNGMIVFDYRRMFKVEITKRQSAGRDALIGALSGFFVGGITGVV